MLKAKLGALHPQKSREGIKETSGFLSCFFSRSSEKGGQQREDPALQEHQLHLVSQVLELVPSPASGRPHDSCQGAEAHSSLWPLPPQRN